MSFKMVRDGQREWAAAHGVSGSWRTSRRPARMLARKLGEELSEYTGNWDPAELYDLRDVLDELITLADPRGTHALAHELKTAELGLFKAHLEWSPVPGLDG